MSNDIKYQFAYNESDEVISISDVTKEYRAAHSFHCIECGSPMIARLGKDRVPHFAHGQGSESCNSESYLHKIAKKLIKGKFDNSDIFTISYYRDIVCKESKNCPFFNNEWCHKRELELFDLKKYYDKCVEETFDGEKKADILLFSSDHPERSNVSIEVVVSHDISPDDPRKIIRAEIKTEDDIIKFLDNIAESKADEYGAIHKSYPIISFHNFSRTSNTKKSLSGRVLNRFFLSANGDIFTNSIEDINEYPCSDKRHRSDFNSVLEICFDPEQYSTLKPSVAGTIIALDKGLLSRSCVLCKYLHESFCSMSKNYGTPNCPNARDASFCRYYSINEKLVSYGRYLLNSGKLKFEIVGFGGEE